MYTSAWGKWEGKTVRPLLCPEGSSGCLTLWWHLKYSPGICCLLKRWTLHASTSWPYSMLCSVRISGHTPPSLAKNLFPEQVFVSLWTHLFWQAIPTCSGTGMDAGSSRDGVPFSPYSPMHPSSFHPRRWTAPGDAEPSSTFRLRCRLTWCKFKKMLVSCAILPVAYFLKGFFSFTWGISIILLSYSNSFVFQNPRIFCDVELLRTASLSFCMSLPAV